MKKRGLLIVLVVLFLFALSMSMSLVWKNNRRPTESKLMLTSARVGVVEIRGVILDVKETLEEIKTFRDDASIKAIVLRIESPGGGVGPSQEIYQEIRQTITKKPVVASMGGIAASGGYYVAAAANHIVANPGTLTGSIGVIVRFSNFSGLFDKVGYEMVTLKSGQFKDIGNPGRKMTPEEEAITQKLIDEVHQQFIQDVVNGRNLPEDQVRPIADGRVLTGALAKQLGLVDELGNFRNAVKAAGRLAKIQEEPKLVYPEKKKRTVADFLLGTEFTQQVSQYVAESWHPLRYQAPFPISP
ncbi:MAG TPA: signal peptide peptidase SppA [Syntrophobacteraceae bacterium]|nr:signal peptide peptidase SppA [Syntrophobacteraceae bacterium]